MLQWLGITLLAGLIIWWNFKRKKTGSCCSGCESCPLKCAGRNIESKEVSAK
ncbi:MAG: FeoB-associated Cys-rich membrane protein [Firmicutes bacterium]|nr:FeoB-associated Cys-rich membrane protein [Bacillota bacterium]